MQLLNVAFSKSLCLANQLRFPSANGGKASGKALFLQTLKTNSFIFSMACVIIVCKSLLMMFFLYIVLLLLDAMANISIRDVQASGNDFIIF